MIRKAYHDLRLLIRQCDVAYEINTQDLTANCGRRRDAVWKDHVPIMCFFSPNEKEHAGDHCYYCTLHGYYCQMNHGCPI